MSSEPVSMYDVGGTWLRYRGPGGEYQVPSPSRLRLPNASNDQLIHMLLEQLVEDPPPNATVLVSLGAAMDEMSGEVYGSAPLWGGRLTPSKNFKQLLQERRPDCDWRIYNDVTAGLASAIRNHAHDDDEGLAYLTISSGIALRTAHLPSKTIRVANSGLQGEVGHLMACSSAPSSVRNLKCDCGARGHIASISAGPAIPRVASALRKSTSSRGNSRHEYSHDEVPEDAVLQTIVEPIAELIRTISTLSPHVTHIVLGGGVVTGIGKPYVRELHRQISQTRSYVDFPQDLPQISVVDSKESDTINGLQDMADLKLHVRKVAA